MSGRLNRPNSTGYQLFLSMINYHIVRMI